MEQTEHEAGMAEPGTGHDTIERAVSQYWTEGDGSFRTDRDSLVEAIDAPVVTYEDREGHPLLILEFVELEDGWHLDQSSSCYLDDAT